LIDSIHEEFAKKNIKCQSISLPWSKLGLKKTIYKSLLFNRNYFFQLVKNKISASKNFSAYELIFKKSKAKLIIGIGLGPELCMAAKKNNVITVELLHGIGYTFIPWGWDKLDQNSLPAKIFVLDNVSRETFKPLESKGVSIIKVPHPFYKRILDPQYTVPVEWSYNPQPGKKNILITLQWGYDGELSELSGFLGNGLFYEELEWLVKKRSDFFWHFRLHPVQMKGANSKKIISFMENFSTKHINVVWEKSSIVPLASIASVCDAHITMSSMSCYDVAMLGLPSLVLCPTTRDNGIYKDYFTDLVNEDYVIKKTVDVNIIEAWIDGIKKKGPRSLGIFDNDVWNSLIFEFQSGERDICK
jgi:hypothetical protein